MATNYPSSIDTPTNPIAGNTLNSPSHSAQHAFENDAIVALETKVGITGSAVTTTVDYKLSGLPASDKAASLTGTETLLNKTLGTGFKITLGSDGTGDIYYRTSGGVIGRLAAGTAGQILNIDSVSGVPTWIANPSAADASIVPVKGVVVLATQAKVDAADDTNTTTAKNVVTPSTLRARLINSGVQDTGTSTAYAIAPSPAITAYAALQEFTMKAAATNTTTTPTLNVNALGAKTIVNPDGSALKVGQITIGGNYTFVYDGTSMQLVTQGAISTPVYQLVATNTISISMTNATTTTLTTFSGLAGDTEDDYMLVFEIDMASYHTANFVGVRLNGDATSSYYLAGSGAPIDNFRFLQGTSTGITAIAGTCFATVYIKATKTIVSTARNAMGTAAYGQFVSMGGYWGDTTNQVTSVNIVAQQNSGSTQTGIGKASLYKINR